MAEYLAPGVFVEETSYRTKSIEGVATTTTGFAGQCRFGPVRGEPRLVTSFEEFRRFFGGLEDLEIDGTYHTNYLAHGVKAFFENGGQRCYIARLFGQMSDALPQDGLYNNSVGSKVAAIASPISNSSGDKLGRFSARYPGRAGNGRVVVSARRSQNLLRFDANDDPILTGVRPGDVVEFRAGTQEPAPVDDLATEIVGTTGSTDYDELVADPHLAYLNTDGEFKTIGNSTLEVQPASNPNYFIAQRVTLTVEVHTAMGTEQYTDLSAHPESARFIGHVMRTENPVASVAPPYDQSAAAWFEPGDNLDKQTALDLLRQLVDTETFDLTGGDDGAAIGKLDLSGAQGEGYYQYGLKALEEVEDIALVAAPGVTASGGPDGQEVRNQLISHCERDKYRFAILSGDEQFDVSQVRDARAKHDSKYAGFYYPWVVITDPFGRRGDTLALPPDGFIAGICARSDIERGVHKAPANEVVRGALGFNRQVTRGQQEVLNPEGINCLRYFEGRGNLVWGARTISSDPEWKYVNIRRLFIYLEHSIDRSTQWAVFEPNNEDLWIKIRMTIEAFLRNEQRKGAIMGREPDEGFFVRCDRSTMTQNDLDNGRLICEVGINPTYPAEFVIFRIGQWTADAEQ